MAPPLIQLVGRAGMPRGGRRDGAGRPNRACDRLPRRGSKLENEIERLKYITGEIHPFAGDSLALMQAVYGGEYIATRGQIYAANAAMSREHAPAVLVDGRSIEEIREEVRQEFLRPNGVDPAEKILEQARRIAEVHREERKIKLRSLIEAGELDPALVAVVEAVKERPAIRRQASLVLSLCRDEDDAREAHVSE